MRFAVAVLLAVAAGCGRATEHTDITGANVQAVAGDTVTLRIGDTAVLGDVVRLTFLAVEGDSRCPLNVQCVWEGDAELRLRAQQAPGDSSDLVLHTTVQPRATTVGEFRIEVVGLEPQPVQGEPIEPQHYSVRLAISRG